MRIHDFGLWFNCDNGLWYSTIPEEGCFTIYYDGVLLGRKISKTDLYINEYNPRNPYVIKFRDDFFKGRKYGVYYNVGRLVLADFEIIPNPDYKGAV